MYCLLAVPDRSGSGIFSEERLEQSELVWKRILKELFDLEVEAWNGLGVECTLGESFHGIIVLSASEDEQAAFGSVYKNDLCDSDVAVVRFQGKDIGGAVVGGEDLDHEVGRSIDSLFLNDVLPVSTHEEQVGKAAAEGIYLNWGAGTEDNP